MCKRVPANLNQKKDLWSMAFRHAYTLRMHLYNLNGDHVCKQ